MSEQFLEVPSQRKPTTDDEIKYTAYPTAAKFHADNKSLVRVMLGPVGGGKTVTCIMEVLRLALAQEAYRGMRRTRWGIVRSCYDDQTEILTGTRGWQYFKNLFDTDTVAQINPQTNKMEFIKPNYLHKAPYVGEMQCFQGEGVDFCVTPDHWMLTSKRRGRGQIWGPYELSRCEDIYGNINNRLLRVCEQEGIDLGFTEKQFEWFGFWFAEGYVNLSKGSDGAFRREILVTQKKPEGIEYGRQLFIDAEIPFLENTRQDGGVNFRVKTHRFQDVIGNRIFDLLKDCGSATIKYIPQWMKEAKPTHLQAFLKGFAYGDGHKRKDSVTQTLYTSSESLANDLQEIIQRAGMTSNLAYRDRRGQLFNINGVEFTTNAKEFIITLVGESKYRPRLWQQGNQYSGWYKKHYDGIVYCVEVPSHVILTRRNGKIMWGSNTYPELKNTTLKTWREWIPERLCHINMQPPYSGVIRQPLPDGTEVEAEVIFLALDQADDVKKLKSMEFTGIFINEIRYCDETVFQTCIERIKRFPPAKPDEGFKGATWSGVIADTNAWASTHWLYDTFDTGSAPERYTLYTQPPAIFWVNDGKDKGHWEVNPDAENLAVLDSSYYKNQLLNGKDDILRVELGLERGISRQGKPVFPQFTEKKHVAEKMLEPRRGLPILIGFDWGLNPAAVLMQFMPGGIIHILDAISPADESLVEMLDQYLLPLLNKRYSGFKLQGVGDPSNQRSAIDKVTPIMVVRERGIHAIPARTNNFLPRKEAVDWFLDRHKFLVSPHLTAIREGFAGGYHYEELQGAGNKGRFKERPVKNNYSHGMDCIQYGCLYLKYGSGGFAAPRETGPEKRFKYA